MCNHDLKTNTIGSLVLLGRVTHGSKVKGEVSDKEQSHIR